VDDPETGRRVGAGHHGANHREVVLNQHPGGEGSTGARQDRREEHP
jgi:hypothetical protein